MFPNIAGRPIGFDTETTGLDWHTNAVYGVSLSVGEEDFYWDIRREPGVVPWLLDNLPKASSVAGHNVSFDVHFLLQLGMTYSQLHQVNWWDTMIVEALTDEHQMQYNLDAVLGRRLGTSKVNTVYQELADLFGGKPDRKSQILNLQYAPVEMVAPYAKGDSRQVLDLYHHQMTHAKKVGLEQVIKLEHDLFPCLREQEHRGIKVDVGLAEQKMEELQVITDRLQVDLNREAGFPINPNPSGSIKKLFAPELVFEHPTKPSLNRFVAIDGTPLSATGAGNPSLNAAALKSMRHPAAKLILRVRKLLKMKDTFLKGHVIGHAVNGRVHPRINQTKTEHSDGTGTGRLSYTEPALQQIPARDKEMKDIIAPVFLPEDGQKWTYGDYSAMDHRCFLHFLNNDKLTEQFRDDPTRDYHQFVADITGLSRQGSKPISLGIVFGMGSGSVAGILGLPTEDKSFTNRSGNLIEYTVAGEEAQEMIDQYHAEIPGIEELSGKIKARAKGRGFLKTIGGRHLHFPAEWMVRKAAGLLYQSTAADINKRAIISGHHWANENGGRYLLSIHDNHNMSLPADTTHGQLREASAIACDHPDLRIPMVLNYSELSDNFGEASNADEVV